MQNAAAMLYCPNYTCQAPNPESHKFCQRCRTLLPKHYLWAVGRGIDAYQAGELVAGRYLLKHSRVLLDLHPGNLPDAPSEIDPDIEPYLRLSSYRLNIPQVYGWVELEEGRSLTPIWLLEEIPVYPEGAVIAAERLGQNPDSIAGQLMPELSSLWQQASALRQLHWLWQVAQLWQPLSSERVASTLLDTTLLRVEGGLVRILELRIDQSTPSLIQLGQLWSKWSAAAQPEITDFLKQVCQQLIKGQVQSGEQLVAILDQGLKAVGQPQGRSLNLATLTDQGPSRQRNEDACYPASGTVSLGNRRQASEVPLVIVCDGIGGHEGGNVASSSAIATVQQHLQSLTLPLEPETLTQELEEAVYAANDLINQRNDSEQRMDRQRMGTTLVMAVGQGHELYLGHVGDSRAYRITRTGCHQVTLDDDVASREMRLGYTLYREALLQPGSGSLVQALGMAASNLLHPTVQRFVLDEDCIFLLCSDGLSDNDRVEECWETDIVPILDGSIDLATASQRLVAIANTQNGHDNVTVGLIHCQVMDTPGQPVSPDLAISRSSPKASTSINPNQPIRSTKTADSRIKTQILTRRKPTHSGFRLLGLIFLLIIGSGLAYLLVPGISQQLNPLLGLAPEPTASPELSPSPSPTANSPSPTPSSGLTAGSLVQLGDSGLRNPQNQLGHIVLQDKPGTHAPINPTAARLVPLGSVVQIQSKQEIPNQEVWLNLKVCSTPTKPTVEPKKSGASPAEPAKSVKSPSSTPSSPPPSVGTKPPEPVTARSGEEGWILETAIAPFVVTSPPTLNPTQVGGCTGNR